MESLAANAGMRSQESPAPPSQPCSSPKSSPLLSTNRQAWQKTKEALPGTKEHTLPPMAPAANTVAR